ncbi:hypothetical protein AC578_9890 [Pseudocercospora eumusae]|uniref:Uncharacterized protein n=1 Tax=Pseudocercospora eumusae TaxID=321146 RepID=A0A139HAZ7_9PEZI|nr:hypothetical protein AC578_9890 [Pseudocercospora eumusae]
MQAADYILDLDAVLLQHCQSLCFALDYQGIFKANSAHATSLWTDPEPRGDGVSLPNTEPCHCRTLNSACASEQEVFRLTSNKRSYTKYTLITRHQQPPETRARQMKMMWTDGLAVNDDNKEQWNIHADYNAM